MKKIIAVTIATFFAVTAFAADNASTVNKNTVKNVRTEQVAQTQKKVEVQKSKKKKTRKHHKKSKKAAAATPAKGQ